MSSANFALSKAKIAIVGLGLMGGSLALALKGKCAALLGVDPDPSTRELARRQNIVSRVESDPADLLPQADVVILAAPVPAILTLLQGLPLVMPNPCIVLDLGSSKQAILERMSALPKRFDVIGGHPICGREKLSLAHADANLFVDSPFVWTTLPRTSERARSCAQQIIHAIGARPVWMEGAEHDRILAITSHLPYLLSCALVLTTPEESAPLVGPGFRSSTRLAATLPSMMLGVLQTNRTHVLDALEHFRAQFSMLENAIQNHDIVVLEAILEQAHGQYESLNHSKSACD